ncbi:hypothetical protein FH972_023099 [Carpinus fangiana]|uniref:Pyroglutamyl-peptidase I n=1 Tax=Carpinus fangiana TaxID=176857 RepID=A0A5N6KUM1_9ROSI|nr:hypothetical protein FH972_023099 [Carpinus fangiana]
MSTNKPDSPPTEVINVLLTGFGTFRDAPETNASWEIVKRLPSALSDFHSHATRIRIFVPSESIPVVFEEVDKLYPTLYDGHAPIHIVLHLGVAQGRSYYTLETIAHRDGYTTPDVTHKLPQEKSQPAFWKSSPAVLHIQVPVQKVMERWQADAKEFDLRVSTDAGKYLCEYIFFSSLAYLNAKLPDESSTPKHGIVAFLHVPSHHDEKSLTGGVKVTAALIRALVESRHSHDNNSITIASHTQPNILPS